MPDDMDNPSVRNPLDWTMRVAGRKFAEAIDDSIRQALIGSKIEDIRIKPIKDEPDFYWMTIKTDAIPLVKINRVKFNNNSVIYTFQKQIYDTSTIKVKIKL